MQDGDAGSDDQGQWTTEIPCNVDRKTGLQRGAVGGQSPVGDAREQWAARTRHAPGLGRAGLARPRSARLVAHEVFGPPVGVIERRVWSAK